MKFLTVARGMFGYYVLLADNFGPIERVEDWNYDTAEECMDECVKLGIVWNIKVI